MIYISDPYCGLSIKKMEFFTHQLISNHFWQGGSSFIAMTTHDPADFLHDTLLLLSLLVHVMHTMLFILASIMN